MKSYFQVVEFGGDFGQQDFYVGCLVGVKVGVGKCGALKIICVGLVVAIIVGSGDLVAKDDVFGSLDGAVVLGTAHVNTLAHRLLECRSEPEEVFAVFVIL